jgi:type III pantothenate kinase
MIVFDIGNTDIVIGIFKENKLDKTFRIKSLTSENFVYFEYRLLNFLFENNINFQSFSKVVISSVVPKLSPIFIEISKKHFLIEPVVLSPKSFPNIKILIDDPSELGSDIFCNVVAAYSKYKSACIIVDFGTALTFTAVTANAEILGVAIAPGLKTAVKSLFSNTAQLPEVPLELPTNAIGKNTPQAIQSGVLLGYQGLVKEIILNMKSELKDDCKIIATGGLSSILKSIKNEFDEININLTIEGIQLIGNYQE